MLNFAQTPSITLQVGLYGLCEAQRCVKISGLYIFAKKTATL